MAPASSDSGSGDSPSDSSPSSPANGTPSQLHHTNLAVRDKGKAVELNDRRKRTIQDGEESVPSRRRTREPSPASAQEDKDYDPNQPVEARRDIQRRLRDLQRDLQENQEDYIRADSSKLLDYFKQANNINAEVKRTSEAAIDSRGLLMAADIAAKQTQLLVSGNVANGVDVDEFVSKCITYMLQGRGIADDNARELSNTQRQRRRSVKPGRGAAAADADDDEIGDEGDMMNWEHLGQFACLPNVRRPAVQGFLLGPLSLERKARRAVARTARLKINSLTEVRPEVLDAQDLDRNEKGDLTLICGKILKQLEVAQATAQQVVMDMVDAAQSRGEDVSREQQRAWMEENHVRDTGGIDLLRFVVNPHSFSQTVENMFYVSFLIRDGKVKIDFDDNGLPSLESMDLQEDEEGGGARQSGSMKHQAIMSLDMATWRELVEAFDIKDPMIPHRNEDHLRQPSVRGWYS